ncbi:Flp family type IVb pilin [Xenophilus sp. Marseille-Q4582]|uniref:Flp family type IVb pilin n=1 Tax=Xenophilus sp. Marseille-Q4582 TaxID=2866600 RepID=UPI001CE49A1C|nr:hypothetical protein [Xenophilus sp. Marseille-Q4582]
MNSILRTAPQVRNRQRGQGMVEYIIIVALIALGSIAVYAAFGDTMRAQVSNASSVLAGGNKQSVQEMNDAKDKAKDNVNKTLQNY